MFCNGFLLNIVRPICKKPILFSMRLQFNVDYWRNSLSAIRDTIKMRLALYGIIAVLSIPVLSIPADKTTTLSWWQEIPQKLTDLLTMKMNLFTALPLEMAATAIDTLCECKY